VPLDPADGVKGSGESGVADAATEARFDRVEAGRNMPTGEGIEIGPAKTTKAVHVPNTSTVTLWSGNLLHCCQWSLRSLGSIRPHMERQSFQLSLPLSNQSQDYCILYCHALFDPKHPYPGSL
jgi:hypothetical protein